VKNQYQTAAQLRDGIVSEYLLPPPTTRAITMWLKREGVAYTKSNPKAKRGGGPVYFSVAGARRVFESMTGGAK
jgi:hypothetical protein